MREEIYYFVPEQSKEAVLFVVLNFSDSIVVYTKSNRHWLKTDTYKEISLTRLLDSMKHAIQEKKTLSDFSEHIQKEYSQQNWSHDFVKQLLGKKLDRNFDQASIKEKFNVHKDAFFKALLSNLSATGFPEGLSQIDDPKVYFDGEDTVRPVVYEDEIKLDKTKLLTFSVEVEDLFLQIKDNDDLYELFTDYNYQQEIIAYLKEYHRDEIIEYATVYDRNSIREHQEDFMFQELVPEKNQQIFSGMGEQVDEALFKTLEENKSDVAEEIEADAALPLEDMFQQLKEHEYFGEFKEDYEFEIERKLLDLHKDELAEFLKTSFASEIATALNEVVFEELIFDFWENLFMEKIELLTNAMKQVISDNLTDVRSMLD